MRSTAFRRIIAAGAILLAAAGTAKAGPVVLPDPAIWTEVTAEAAPGFPGRTIYYPTDLDAFGEPLPIFAWANGACFSDHTDNYPFLRTIAAAGYFVIGIGEPPGSPGGFPVGMTAPNHDEHDHQASVDWAIAQADAEGSKFAGHLDPERVAVGGLSCGGNTALDVASVDERVKAVFNLTGSAGGGGAPREEKEAILRTVTAPIGTITGGPADHHYGDARIDWDVAPAALPMFLVSHAFTEHTTTGAMLFGTTPNGNDAAEIGVHWLNLILRDDADAREYLLGDTFGRCVDNPACLWTAQHKNLG